SRCAPLARWAPRLLAAARPTFTWLCTKMTEGNSRRSISSQPSNDPSSTTITSGCARRQYCHNDPTQRRTCAAECPFTMMIDTLTGLARSDDGGERHRSAKKGFIHGLQSDPLKCGSVRYRL